MAVVGKCCIGCTTFTITIAIIFQLFLIITNWTPQQLIYKSLVSYSIWKAQSRYQLPSSNDDFLKHNQCTDPFTNQTVSCELVGFNLFFSFILPDWEYVATAAPETFLDHLRNPSANDVMYANPTGTVYDYFRIFNLRTVFVHSNLNQREDRASIVSNGCIVYFHGGGFVTGSAFTSLKFLSYLHLFTGIPVLGVDYRLAPEYPLYDVPFHEDADYMITEYLHNKLGLLYKNIYVIGDSAGGGVSISVMQYLSLKGISIGGGIFISPTIHWTRSKKEAEKNVNNGYDAMLSHHSMDLFRQYKYGCRDHNGEYVEGGIDYSDIEQCIAWGSEKLESKGLNPMNHDWSKMKGSHMLWIASQYELLKVHSVWGHEKALENGIDSTLIIIPNNSLHILPVFVDIPEGLKAVVDISNVVRQWRG